MDGRARVAADGRLLTRGITPLLSGAFLVEFDDERAAQAAARDCRTAAFVVDVEELEGRWLLRLRRKGLFPADERDRYGSRLGRIGAGYGGRYGGFVADAREARPVESITEGANA